MVISVLSISREKMTLDWPLWIEAERSTSMPSVVLPMAGRPAKMISWPPCRPWVRSSNSANPVGTPVTWPPRFWVASIWLRVSSITSPSGTKSSLWLRSVTAYTWAWASLMTSSPSPPSAA